MGGNSRERKRRSRTCADELRRAIARRRERRSDPAGKIALQLLALLSAVLALARPSEPVLDVPRPRRRSRYDPPTDYTLGRDAWARERGLDPQPGTVMTASETPAPGLKPALKSWRRLVRELDSPSPRRREYARIALEQRVPSVVHDWLRREIASEDRTQLRMLGLSAGPAELVERVLRAARVASVPEPEETPELSPEPDVEPTTPRMK